MVRTALSAGARLGVEPPGSLVDRVEAVLANPRALHRSTAEDIGMLLSRNRCDGAARWGTVARHRGDAGEALERHYQHPGNHIFYNWGAGYRRRLSSFASQVYSILALYEFGETLDQDWAVTLVNEGGGPNDPVVAKPARRVGLVLIRAARCGDVSSMIDADLRGGRSNEQGPCGVGLDSPLR